MTSFKLKLIAIITMLIDHTGLTLARLFDTFPMRVIGRVAFPIYAFLIAEGCRRTHDIKKYMLRLFVFALISEMPYDLMVYGQIFDMRRQNVFFTLFLGTAAIWLYERIAGKIPAAVVFACIPFAGLAYLIKTDYDVYGIAAIYFCYVFKERVLQIAALGAVMFALYYSNVYLSLAVLPALLLLALYNGQRGYPLKLAFYAVYPAHLLLLAGVGWYFTNFAR